MIPHNIVYSTRLIGCIYNGFLTAKCHCINRWYRLREYRDSKTCNPESRIQIDVIPRRPLLKLQTGVSKATSCNMQHKPSLYVQPDYPSYFDCCVLISDLRDVLLLVHRVREAACQALLYAPILLRLFHCPDFHIPD